jgi:DNA-binding transcriptional ArsR family regulator
MPRSKSDIGLEAAATLFRNFGNPNRLAILAALLDGELAVGELESELGIRQPILSQQLAILRDAGLLETTRDRKAVVYRIAEGRRETVSRALSAVFDPVVPKRREPAAPKARILPFVSAAVFARVEPVDS